MRSSTLNSITCKSGQIHLVQMNRDHFPVPGKTRRWKAFTGHGIVILLLDIKSSGIPKEIYLLPPTTANRVTKIYSILKTWRWNDPNGCTRSETRDNVLVDEQNDWTSLWCPGTIILHLGKSSVSDVLIPLLVERVQRVRRHRVAYLHVFSFILVVISMTLD